VETVSRRHRPGHRGNASCAFTLTNVSGRLPQEVEVFVWRRRGNEIEVLVLRRCADLGGYWHCVAGAVEPAESWAEAASRELREETGLAVEVVDSGIRYRYAATDVTPERRRELPPQASEIEVACFGAEAPPTAEMRLDWEHDEHAWVSVAEAESRLRWPAVARAMSAVVPGAAGGQTP
jgi:8-oxo-dGTP pyrophosphatase MutT (NUDIX family)